MAASIYSLRAAALPIAVAGIFLGFGLWQERMWSPANLSNILVQASYLSLFAMAQTVVIITRGFDLSLGYSVALTGGAGASLEAVGRIMLQLMLPFVVGHLLRNQLGTLVKRRALVLAVDRGSILLIVYTAFSAAALAGLWQQVSGVHLALLLGFSAALLAVAMGFIFLLARVLRFSLEDRIAMTFCGSQKSLASGVPIAQILFPAAAVGIMVLPLMLFHQLQLVVCSMMAQRWAKIPRQGD